jgi:hypothetical protein
MIRILDTVVLTRDLPEHGLRRGDVGAVVHVYAEAAYEVEFVTGGGTTLAVLTLEGAALRSLAPSDLLHVREVGPA